METRFPRKQWQTITEDKWVEFCEEFEIKYPSQEEVEDTIGENPLLMEAWIRETSLILEWARGPITEALDFVSFRCPVSEERFLRFHAEQKIVSFLQRYVLEAIRCFDSLDPAFHSVRHELIILGLAS